MTGININKKVAKKQAEICMELVRETDRSVIECRQSADQVLAGFYRRHREYGARDRRFFSNAVFSWFRWRGWLKTPADENIAAAILLDETEISAQLEYMYRNFKVVAGVADPGPASPRPATVVSFAGPNLMLANTDSALADLKPLGPLNLNDKAAGLRNLLKCGPLSLEQLVPDWFSDFLYIPDSNEVKDHLAQCIGAFQARPPTWLRLRSDQRQETMRSLTEMKIETGTHPFIEQAVFIKGRKNCDLSQLRGAELQDLASQCVGICCNPGPGEEWWDVCAGAGGKSLHLADLMKDEGLIMATDIRPSILNQLSKRLDRNKYRSIKISLWDGVADLPAVAAPRLQRYAQHCGQVQALQAGPAPDKYFDGVLVDAPCSGMGTWARNPDARWRIFPEQIRNYANIQGNLLKKASTRVKPNGRLVYSTCTMTALENTGLIKIFLEEHQDFRLEPIFNPLTRRQSNGLIWVRPWEWNCNGMFIAVMKKNRASTALP